MKKYKMVLFAIMIVSWCLAPIACADILEENTQGALALSGKYFYFMDTQENECVTKRTDGLSTQIVTKEWRYYVNGYSDETYFIRQNQLYMESNPDNAIFSMPDQYCSEYEVYYFILNNVLVAQQERTIVLVSLDTGRVSTLENCIAYDVAIDENNIYVLQEDRTGDSIYCIKAYDKDGKNQKLIAGMNRTDVYGLSYDYTSEILYWMEGTNLYGMKNGEIEQVCTLPLDAQTTAETAVSFGKYAVMSKEGTFYLFDTSQMQTETLLTIRGIQPETLSIDGAFMLENPNRAIQRNNDNAMTAEDVYTAITGKEDTVDIFLVQWSSSLVELMQRGYLEALNSEGLLADVASMYPAFQEMVTYDGTLYAVPENVIVKGWRVSADMAEQVETPETLAELLDFIEAWEENDANDGRPVVADDVYGAWTAADFASYALEQYVMTAVQQGKEIDFQDENLMALLERIRQMKEQHLLSDTSEPIRSGCVFAAARTLSKYQNSVDVLGASMDRWRIICSPALEAENSPAVGVTLTVYVVNPYSRHIAEAQQFLTYMAQNRHEQIEGCLNAHCAAMLRESAQAELDELSAEERQGVLNKSSSWMYHEAALTAYREQILPYLCVTPCRLLENERQSSVVPWVELQNAVQQYMDGMTDIRSCVQRLNAIVRTQILEN